MKTRVVAVLTLLLALACGACNDGVDDMLRDGVPPSEILEKAPPPAPAPVEDDDPFGINP